LIEGIRSENIEVWWSLVQEYLISALEYSLGEYSIGDIKKACLTRDMQLWVEIGKEVEGALITKINNYPQKKVLVMMLAGGKVFADNNFKIIEESEELLTRFAKEKGCTYIQLFGRRGWIKKMNKLQYKHNRVVLTKEIN
jgi:hypothetical protein